MEFAELAGHASGHLIRELRNQCFLRHPVLRGYEARRPRLRVARTQDLILRGCTLVVQRIRSWVPGTTAQALTITGKRALGLLRRRCDPILVAEGLTMPPVYTLTEAPPIASIWSPTAISDDSGVVVGISADPAGYSAAVIWDGGMPTVLPYTDCSPMDINIQNKVVGAYPRISAPSKTFLYVSEPSAQMKDLSQNVGVAVPNYAIAISNAGLIAGNDGFQFGSSVKAFAYNSIADTVMTVLNPPTGYSQIKADDINDLGHLVGTLISADGKHYAFICRDGKTIENLGEVMWVRRVNKNGILTGTKWFNDGMRAFRLDSSVADPKFEELQPMNCEQSEGWDINDDGAVVLTAQLTGDPSSRGYVYFPPDSPDAGLWDLQSALTTDGWLLSPISINNHGKIVAQGISPQNHLRVVRLDPLQQEQPLQIYGKKIYGALVEFVMMFGGAEVGAGGWGLTYGGKLHPIPPRQDFTPLWQRLPRPAQEALVGKAVQKLASLIDNPRRREALHRAALDLLKGIVEEAEPGEMKQL
jgi:uncharacterized membrane protein